MSSTATDAPAVLSRPHSGRYRERDFGRHGRGAIKGGGRCRSRRTDCGSSRQPSSEAAGSSAAEAGKVAARLVDANLPGHDSHGVIRVPQYVGQVGTAPSCPTSSAEVVRETDAVTVLDGHFGYGQIVGEQSIQAAIDKARRHGIAMSALRHSAHLGRLGDWAEMAAAAGMASLHFVNATGIPLRVVPHGGRDGRGTTNPIAMGIPVAGGAPGDPRLRDLGDRRGQGPGRAQQGRGDPARLPARRRRAGRPPTRTSCTPTRPAAWCRSAARSAATRAARSG